MPFLETGSKASKGFKGFEGLKGLEEEAKRLEGLEGFEVGEAYRLFWHRRLRLQLSVPTKLIETNKHKKTAVKQRNELLNDLLQHADFVSSGCSATRRKFLSATQQK